MFDVAAGKRIADYGESRGAPQRFCATGPPSWKISSTTRSALAYLNFRHESRLLSCAGVPPFAWLSGTAASGLPIECAFRPGCKVLSAQSRPQLRAAVSTVALAPTRDSCRKQRLRKFRCRRELTDGLCHQSRSPRSCRARVHEQRTRLIRWMSRQIDRVGDDRGSGIGHCGGVGEYGDRIGDSQRKAASAPAAGGNAAHRMVEIDALTMPNRVTSNRDGRSGRSTMPTTKFSPAVRCRAMSPPSFTYARDEIPPRSSSRQESPPPLRPPPRPSE